MNKKYIDFVPVNQKAEKKKATPKKVTKSPEVTEFEIDEMFSARTDIPRAGVTVSTVKTSRSVTAAAPKAHFVNTEKVKKRPLSKNVYTKKVVEPKEETPSKPIKIIDRPEKDSKVGLIVTIIITIILGAAAGTVAFLLLPK